MLSTLVRIVLESTNRGAVYPCPNLLELMDGSTSSRVATDYHWLTNLYTYPWYVCMYLCIMYLCIYVCMYAWLYVCMHACMYVCMYVTHCSFYCSPQSGNVHPGNAVSLRIWYDLPEHGRFSAVIFFLVRVSAFAGVCEVINVLLIYFLENFFTIKQIKKCM